MRAAVRSRISAGVAAGVAAYSSVRRGTPHPSAKNPPAAPAPGEVQTGAVRRPNTTIITASPGDAIIINDMAAVTVGVTTLQVSGLFGTDISYFGGRDVILTNDGVQNLPELADMQASLLAKASRHGEPAVRRLRKSFNGILATDSAARVSTMMLWGKPQFIERTGGVQEVDPDAVLGTVFWKENGQYLHTDFTAAGVLNPAAPYRPEQ